MSEAMETARLEASGAKRYLLAAYYLLSGNISLTIALFGALVVVIGATILPLLGPAGTVDNTDVLAGMFGLWGASLFAFGILVYAILWANKLYARFTAERAQEEEEGGAEEELTL